MSIRVECQCGRVRKVKDEHAGKKMKCSDCGQIIRIPQSAESPLDESTFDVDSDEWDTAYSGEENDWGGDYESALPKRKSRKTKPAPETPSERLIRELKDYRTWIAAVVAVASAVAVTALYSSVHQGSLYEP